MKFDIGVFFENLLRKFKFHKIGQETGASHVDKYTFLIISRSVPLRMRNVSVKNCRENKNTFCIQLFFFNGCRL
jgi:hypothetical protein